MKKLFIYLAVIVVMLTLLAGCTAFQSDREDDGVGIVPTTISLLPTSTSIPTKSVEATAVAETGGEAIEATADAVVAESEVANTENDSADVAVDSTPTPRPVNTAPLSLADPSSLGVDVVLAVDITNPLHRISPMIYGVNFGEEDFIEAANIPVRRWGGNATTRYNWKTDVSNRASDWFFLNVPNELDNPGALPFGSSADQFVAYNKSLNVETVQTMPLIGWTPTGRERTCSFSVEKYGPQQYEEPYGAGCGNGAYEDGTLIVDNDPFDVHEQIGTPFVQDWMSHLIGQFGTAADGGVRYYSLDNEPMLWHHTHRDIHPGFVGYDDLRDLSYEYAAAIKEVDPDAETFGPVLWGWTAYSYSALDSAEGGSWWGNPPDQRAHDDIPLAEWYLQEMARYEANNGVRLLDYFDLHYYPQSANVALTEAVDLETQALRLRSTRSLWDIRYDDESWIDEPIRLIPLMRQWVNTHYPDTKTALTEYNWGAVSHINGALAQADVLGIFGRERLDFATMWDPPTLDEPTAFAFKMYRNYDGQNSTFGDLSVPALTSDSDLLAVYAAVHEESGVATIMVVNKSMQDLSGYVGLPLIGSGTAAVYRYSEHDLGRIEELPPQPLDNGFSAQFPVNSITLFVIE